MTAQELCNALPAYLNPRIVNGGVAIDIVGSVEHWICLEILDKQEEFKDKFKDYKLTVRIGYYAEEEVITMLAISGIHPHVGDLDYGRYVCLDYYKVAGMDQVSQVLLCIEMLKTVNCESIFACHKIPYIEKRE